MLASYNLFSIVNFPTRVQKNHTSAVDIFLNYARINYTIFPFTNGLSDHGAQYVLIMTLTH
jgi:hypothetical protein